MLSRENRAGIYLTVSIHLGALILFLIYQIGFQLQQAAAFVLDFTQQEEKEMIAQRELMRTEVSQELEDLLRGSAAATRNVVVNATERGQQLRDDRFNNPSQVYDEARQLQEKLDASRRAAQALQGSDDVAPLTPEKKPTTETYKGPSVLTWKLEGRKAQHLSIPVYKCLGGGDVTVMIGVNKRGYVVAASVVTAFSSSDECLKEFAIRAAKESRFSASETATDPQQGEIVYRFIAQ
ncbi:MAG: hypothetical protein LBC84_02765 [Prevotellaceae bacterium]|jgi:hypothetical protein|nr:hypothetical protein [Prevotellaceae bacterium]